MQKNFNNEETWIKKNCGQFDVTMGAYDGAEVCELEGIFLLFQLLQHYKREDFGLMAILFDLEIR